MTFLEAFAEFDVAGWFASAAVCMDRADITLPKHLAIVTSCALGWVQSAQMPHLFKMTGRCTGGCSCFNTLHFFRSSDLILAVNKYISLVAENEVDELFPSS